MKPRVDIDIARNIKTIEWLKTELLTSVADLFRGMREAQEDVVLDRLASVTTAAYALGRRLGVEYDRMDELVRQKARANIERAQEFEEWYGDFSALGRHFE